MEYFTTEEIDVFTKLQQLTLKAPSLTKIELDSQDDQKCAFHNTLKNSYTNIEELDDDNFQRLILEHYIPILEYESFFVQNGRNYAYILLKLLDVIEANKAVLESFPLHRSDHKGTAHSQSSFNKLVDGQLSYLDNLLNRDKLGLASQREKNIQSNVYTLVSQTKETKSLAVMELINFGFYLNMDVVNIIENEEIFLAIENASDFFNGVRSEPHEIVKSSMIMCAQILKHNHIVQHISPEILSEFILMLHSNIFYEHFEKDYKKNRRYLTFGKDDFEKDAKVKTIFKRTVPIWTFRGGKSAFDDIQDTMDDIDYLFIKLCVKYLKKQGFSKTDRKVFFKSLLPKFIDIMLQQSQGNLPHA